MKLCNPVLNWHDYGARFFDLVLGRFLTIDPLAENNAFQSTFIYADNNLEMVTTLKYGSRKESISKLLKRLNSNLGKGIDAYKFSGQLKLKNDPLKIQKAL